jgi:hypothetical protein
VRINEACGHLGGYYLPNSIVGHIGFDMQAAGQKQSNRKKQKKQ